MNDVPSHSTSRTLDTQNKGQWFSHYVNRAIRFNTNLRGKHTAVATPKLCSFPSSAKMLFCFFYWEFISSRPVWITVHFYNFCFTFPEEPKERNDEDDYEREDSDGGDYSHGPPRERRPQKWVHYFFILLILRKLTANTFLCNSKKYVEEVQLQVYVKEINITAHSFTDFTVLII